MRIPMPLLDSAFGPSGRPGMTERHSILMFADLITFAHLSLSLFM